MIDRWNEILTKIPPLKEWTEELKQSIYKTLKCCAEEYDAMCPNVNGVIVDWDITISDKFIHLMTNHRLTAEKPTIYYYFDNFGLEPMDEEDIDVLENYLFVNIYSWVYEKIKDDKLYQMMYLLSRVGPNKDMFGFHHIDINFEMGNAVCDRCLNTFR